MISADQKAHFETFGYLLVRQLFTRAEIAEISRHFDSMMEEDKNGREPPAGTRGHCSGGILKKCVNGQAVYPLSEQHGLEAQERRYTAHEEGKH